MARGKGVRSSIHGSAGSRELRKSAFGKIRSKRPRVRKAHGRRR